MGIVRPLVALYPPKWREAYGEEFAAHLECTRLTPTAVLDVVIQAGKLRAEGHPRLTLVLVSLAWSACMEYLSVRDHLTANILWAPTNPVRALALAATTGPWLAFAAVAVARWCRRAQDAAAGKAAP
jgi:hypothetical protein